jgi:uncharacterized membrane protein
MVVVVASLAACGGDEQGVDTGSTCPPTDPPTYASFGADFFTRYCLDCHSETRRGADRHDAPLTIDFDTRSLVRENTSRIDRQAASGPAAHNLLMPPSDFDPRPTDEERVRLGQYIACEIGR